MLTWGMCLDKLRRFIKDEIKGAGDTSRPPKFTDDELVDFWADAQDDLVNYVARPATFTVQAGLDKANLPDDLYRVEAVLSPRGEVMLQLGEDNATVIDEWEGVSWVLGHSELYFTDRLDCAATVRYRAYYPAPKVGERDMPILVPRWAIKACIYHCAAQVVEKQVIADPQLRQFASKTQDAGKPTDNPFLQVAKYMLERYRQTVYDHISDSQERTTWHSSYP